jgi:hypothetical protein
LAQGQATKIKKKKGPVLERAAQARQRTDVVRFGGPTGDMPDPCINQPKDSISLWPTAGAGLVGGEPFDPG